MYKSIAVGSLEYDLLGPCQTVLKKQIGGIKGRIRNLGAEYFEGFYRAEAEIEKIATNCDRSVELFGLWNDGYIAYLADLALKKGVDVRIPKRYAFNSPGNPKYSLEQDIIKSAAENGFRVKITRDKEYTYFRREK